MMSASTWRFFRLKIFGRVLFFSFETCPLARVVALACLRHSSYLNRPMHRNSSISTFGNELLNGLGLRLAFSQGKMWSTDARSVWQEEKPNLSYRKSARKPGAACS